MATFTRTVRFREAIDATALSDVDASYTDLAGDGVTDNYAALKSAAQALTKHPGARLYFPHGTYYIGQYKIGGANAQSLAPNSVTDIYWDDLRDVEIVGDDATILVKGDFLRSYDNSPTTPRRSVINAVTPFAFRRCRDFVVRGITVNGQVGLMTRTESVVEGGGTALSTARCTNYTLQDCVFEYCSCDGLMLGAATTIGATPFIADRNGALVNVKSRNNARNNLSVLEVCGLTLDADCELNDAGRTGGVYGWHSPIAGCDIEPDISGDDLDVETGSITFDGCSFLHNLGGQLTTARNESGTDARCVVHDVTVIRCTLAASEDSTPYPLIFAVDNGLIEDCDIETGTGEIWPCWLSSVGEGVGIESDVTIRNCRITTLRQGIRAAVDGVPVLIEGCTITGRGTTGAYMPYCTGTGVSFVGNTIWTPKEWAGELTGPIAAAQVSNGVLSAGNHWTTDLDTGTAHFVPIYSGITEVDEDWFESPTGRGYTPQWNGTYWDPAVPYSYHA